MTKKERLAAIINGETPDAMPVFPFILTHGVYSNGWTLPDITGQGWLDTEKSAKTVTETVKKYNYDFNFGSYIDLYFGLDTLGGVLKVPDQIGGVVGASKYPVETPQDWPEVKKKMASIFEKDNRIKSTLDAIKMVAKEIGDEYPIMAWGMPGATNASCLLRVTEALCKDTLTDPKFAHDLFDHANKFCMEFIRRQYDAGCNSLCFIGDVFGTELISPKMYEEFGAPYVVEIVDMVRKEFNQDTWLHVHGSFFKPKAGGILEKLITETGVKGVLLDQDHSPEWLDENISKKYNIPTGIPYHCPYLWVGPEDRIEREMKEYIPKCNSQYSFMAPSCEIPPDVPENHFKKWVEVTHNYSKEIYNSKK